MAMYFKSLNAGPKPFHIPRGNSHRITLEGVIWAGIRILTGLDLKGWAVIGKRSGKECL